MWWAILLTVVLTSLLTIVVFNLRAGEKHIGYQLTHRFSVEDPQFLRCMGQLLGPGILPGNRITALHNGDQIFPAMLEAIRGAREPTMYHCKVLIVDEVWVSVGSTNFDDRSFRLNDEANLNIYDATFAGEQMKVFLQDQGKSRLMTRAEFKNRSAVGKLFDSLAGMFRRQL